MRARWQRAVAAFTLIEITMVSGIIGGAQGSYAGALNRAKRQVCEHNLKQIYQGLLMKDLFDGGLPKISFYSKDPKKDPNSLLRVLGPEYAGVLVCPCIPEDIKKSGLTYVFNDELGGKSLDTVPRRRTTWLVMGMTAVVRDPKDPRKLAGQQPHSGGVNVLYADGHIEFTKTPPRLRAVDAPKEEGEQEQEPAPPAPEPRPQGPSGLPDRVRSLIPGG